MSVHKDTTVVGQSNVTFETDIKSVITKSISQHTVALSSLNDINLYPDKDKENARRQTVKSSKSTVRGVAELSRSNDRVYCL